MLEKFGAIELELLAGVTSSAFILNKEQTLEGLLAWSFGSVAIVVPEILEQDV